MDERIIKTAEVMNKKGFFAECAKNAEEARDRVLEIVKGDTSIGIGGSVTIAQTGIYDALVESGHTVLSAVHAAKIGADTDEARRAGLSADAYLLSANAVTDEGDIINIDGTGNRVAAAIYGPKKVVYVIGKNKLVKDLAEGIARIKRDACPKNAVRLGLKTPCGLTGKCTDCKSSGRMCNATTIIEYPLRDQTVHVIFIDEELGY